MSNPENSAEPHASPNELMSLYQLMHERLRIDAPDSSELWHLRKPDEVLNLSVTHHHADLVEKTHGSSTQFYLTRFTHNTDTDTAHEELLKLHYSPASGKMEVDIEPATPCERLTWQQILALAHGESIFSITWIDEPIDPPAPTVVPMNEDGITMFRGILDSFREEFELEAMVYGAPRDHLTASEYEKFLKLLTEW